MEDLLQDDAFKLAWINAAVEAAEQVKVWILQNEEEEAFFQEQLLKHMNCYLAQEHCVQFCILYMLAKSIVR